MLTRRRSVKFRVCVELRSSAHAAAEERHQNSRRHRASLDGSSQRPHISGLLVLVNNARIDDANSAVGAALNH